MEIYWKSEAKARLCGSFSQIFPKRRRILEIYWKSEAEESFCGSFSQIFPKRRKFLEICWKKSLRRNVGMLFHRVVFC